MINFRFINIFFQNIRRYIRDYRYFHPWFLGTGKNRKLELSQATYIDKLLLKYVTQDSKKCLLPFRHGIPLSQDQCPKTLEEKTCM